MKYLAIDFNDLLFPSMDFDLLAKIGTIYKQKRRIFEILDVKFLFIDSAALESVAENHQLELQQAKDVAKRLADERTFADVTDLKQTIEQLRVQIQTMTTVRFSFVWFSIHTLFSVF